MNEKAVKRVDASRRAPPPGWALKQRNLISLMDEAAEMFVSRYTRQDGTLIWRERWPGMDGSDDGYESFLTFPLLYILGGSEKVHELARREWNAVTWQFTQYGQVYREFDGYYDWMHHGESSTYLYYLGLADPSRYMDRVRALRFAAMYIGEDPLAPNWDPQLRMIRSPINGSRGPRAVMTAEDWVTHRPVLANYLAPYEDIPGLELEDPLGTLDWRDDEVFGRILAAMNARMVPGDVPLNLNATSLVTHAYLYSGDERYKRWVLDYLTAWQEHTVRNGGIMPDNIGPHGRVGELMGDKWWGGYYGWRWPHGAWIILESTLIAGQNAMLLTGDPSWLDLQRSQEDLLWSLRQTRNGEVVVPSRHSDAGWFDYRPLQSRYAVHRYFMTRKREDWERIQERFPQRDPWYMGPANFGKAGHFWPERWFGYVMGENPDFPDQVLEDTMSCMLQRLEKIERDDWEQVEAWDVHHWQDLNPVVPEGLIQMAMGTPAAIYHGGLLQASVRYFDPARRRPGLPRDVAALVEGITPQGFMLTLVNTHALDPHTVVLQAGAFGEHRFETIQVAGAEVGRDSTVPVHDRLFAVHLPPWGRITLQVSLARFVNRPTYEYPASIR